MKRYREVALLVLVNITVLSAQETPSEFLAAYENEFAVRLADHTFTTIDIKNGELEIKQEFLMKTLFLDNQASAYNTTSLEYEPEFSSLDDLEAYSLVPDPHKDEYNKYKVRSIEDKEVVAEDIFYSGRRGKMFKYEGLQKGAITVLNYTKILTQPYFLGSEVFRDQILRADHLLEIRHDKNVKIDIAYFNCSQSDFEYTREEDGNEIVYRWKPLVYDKIRSEPGMPALLSIAPHIVYRIISYNYKDEEIPVLRNTGDLYNWYNSLLDEVISDKCLPLQSLTDSIVRGAENDSEKTRRIFNWVQNNIKYIAFENGIEGFQPRLPSYVYKKRFGDCKDMSSIMINMLRHAGIESYHTWIGTRELPYSYTDVPSPLADNHMIATAVVNGEHIFLDATNSTLPYLLPSSFIQGKEALIGMGKDSFIVKKVPVIASEFSEDKDSVWLSIKGSNISGTGKKSYTGYFADHVNRLFSNKDDKMLSDRLKASVIKGNNKCKSSNHTIANSPEKTSLTYNFEVPDYAFQHDDKIILNLNLEQSMSDQALKDDRVYPIENNFSYRQVRNYALEIPEGYEIEYLPARQEFNQHEEFKYVIDYKVVDNIIHYTFKTDVNQIILNKDDFEKWNQMIKQLNRSYSESIILTKKI